MSPRMRPWSSALYLAIVLLLVPVRSHGQDSAIENIGHYVVDDFEFFAEDRTTGQKDISERSRLFVMPSFLISDMEYLLLDGADEVRDLAGIIGGAAALAAKEAGLNVNADRKYHGRVTVEFRNALTSDDKEIILCQLFNLVSPAKEKRSALRTFLPSFSKLASVAEFDPGPREGKQDRVRPVIPGGPVVPPIPAIPIPTPPSAPTQNFFEMMLNSYRMEVSAPRNLSVEIKCLGETIGTRSFPQEASVSTFSRFVVECPNLNPATARLFFNGHTEFTATMQVSLSRVQSGSATYDMKNFASVIDRAFVDRTIDVQSNSSKFLFFESTDQSVRTFLNTAAEQTGTESRSQSTSLLLRDADADLRERAIGFIFPTRTAGPSDLDRLIKKHEDREKESSGDLKEAHQEYVVFLKGLKAEGEKGSSGASEKNALDSLGKLLKPSSGTPSAGAAAAPAVDPVSAIASFLVTGLAMKDENLKDVFQIREMRSSSFNSSDTVAFNAMIANQIQSRYTVSLSLLQLISARRAVEAKLRQSEPAKAPEPVQVESAIKAQIKKLTTSPGDPP